MDPYIKDILGFASTLKPLIECWYTVWVGVRLSWVPWRFRVSGENGWFGGFALRMFEQEIQKAIFGFIMIYSICLKYSRWCSCRIQDSTDSLCTWHVWHLITLKLMRHVRKGLSSLLKVTRFAVHLHLISLHHNHYTQWQKHREPFVTTPLRFDSMWWFMYNYIVMGYK